MTLSKHIRILKASVRKAVNDRMRANRAKRVKRIVKKYNTQLLKGAMSRTSQGASLASSLCNDNYIGDRYFMEMVKTINRAEPDLDIVYASTMISVIRRILNDDPDAFPAMIDMLKRHEVLDSVAVKMEKEYCE